MATLPPDGVAPDCSDCRAWPADRYAVLPWTSDSTIDSTTSPRKLARLHGGRVTNWTRLPADWRAPTMSWLMFARNCRRWSGWSAKYRSGALISSTHQKRMSRRGRGSRPSSIMRLSARAISSTLAHPLASSLAEKRSSCRCAVSTTSWSCTVVPRMTASTIACDGGSWKVDSTRPETL